MTHPIQDRINSQRRTARRLVLAFGCGATLATVLGSLLLISVMDYWIRFPNLSARTFGFFVIVLTTLLAGIYLFLPAVRFRLSMLQTAFEIENRFPELKNRLTSSLAFITAQENELEARHELPKPLAGSSQMQEAVIQRTHKMMEGVRWDETYDRSKATQAVVAAVLVLFLFVTWFLWDRENSSMAIRRSLQPWESIEWPQRNDLVFTELPDVVGLGSSFELRVIDRNDQLPKSLILETRKPGDVDSRSFEMTRREDYAVHLIDNVGSHLEFRAIGGDDTTPWFRVRAIDPPETESQTVHVKPPSYTQADAYSCSEDIVGIVGSTLSVTGTTTRKVVNAELVLLLPDGEQRIPLTLDREGRNFASDEETAWTLGQSGDYWVELTDEIGLVGRPSPPPKLIAKEDAPPTAELEVSTLDGFSTRNARIPYSLVAIDDIRLRDVRLTVRTEFGEEIGNVPLITDREPFPDQTTEENADFWGVVDRREYAGEFLLNEFPSIQTGDKLIITCQVEDSFGHITRLDAVEIRTLSDEEFLERLGRYEAKLAKTLREALDAQRRANSLRASVDQIVDDDPAAKSSHRLKLESAEFQQQRVALLIGATPDAALDQLGHLTNSIDRNQLSGTAIGLRLQDVQNRLQRVQQVDLPLIRRVFESWLDIRQSSQGRTGETDDEATRIRTEFVRHQDNVEATLAEIVAMLDRWQDVRGYVDQLSQLKDSQQLLLGDVEQAQVRSLGNLGAESEELRQNRISFSDQQLEIARRLGRVLDSMRSDLNEAGQASSLNLMGLQGTLEIADRLAVTGTMRAAAEEIDRNRLGNAIALQLDAVDGLVKLIESLRNDTAFDREERLDAIDEQLLQLERLIGEQKSIRESFNDLSSRLGSDDTSDIAERTRLATTQRELADRTRELADSVRALNSNETSDHLIGASVGMEDVSAAIGLGAADLVQSRLDRVDSELADALESLQRQAEFENRIAFQTQMGDAVRKLNEILTEQTAIRETTELLARDGSPNEQDETYWIAVLLSREEILLGEIDSMTAGEGLLRSVELVLDQVQNEMRLAVGGLQAKDYGARSSGPMRRAEEMLTRLLGLFEPRNATSAEPGAEPDPESQPPNNARTADLRTIRMLQQSILEQTAELEEDFVRRGNIRTSEAEVRLTNLLELQNQLMVAVVELTEDLRGTVDSAEPPTEDGSENGRPRLVLPLPGDD